MTAPSPFVDLAELIPDLQLDLRYYGSDNFIGAPVDGYETHRAWLTEPAAQALARAQRQLRRFDLSLKLFDAYRPQRAVDHFIRWCDTPCDPALKALYYPSLDKRDLFGEGYLNRRSTHSRGSTVDLTIASTDAGTELDMGTRFDFFGPESWLDCDSISPQARANRLLLQKVMTAEGFIPFHHEWWHFTLRDEPFPDTCFDIPIA
ncbi:D-alanyl-D-alanine dipeptidase [Marinobacterium nitratireducens]|uniref:D-alanyl-D-alanine dipeptidase n=1 Tax=Marinobacterium nitratireducens TaxID=518897 RepID=A0A917ZB09_9GAMM|nr:M15 family metallopeptidase [Marinobacterium nitratireducens]GGO77917.1 D-alanyl-D-alanine dipeptidase [Marinobacterium nitratireducens]